MGGDRKFPRSAALAVTREIVATLQPRTARLIVAGSLRRKKAAVGDIEILYIPRVITAPDPADFFGAKTRQDDSAAALYELLTAGVIEKRLNVRGFPAWGESTKLGRHRASGVPIDFFTATPESWWNTLVCKTGGAQSNTDIACAARDAGWKWCPLSPGFVRGGGWEWDNARERRAMQSEQEVFAFVGLQYLEPEHRQ